MTEEIFDKAEKALQDFYNLQSQMEEACHNLQEHNDNVKKEIIRLQELSAKIDEDLTKFSVGDEKTSVLTSRKKSVPVKKKDNDVKLEVLDNIEKPDINYDSDNVVEAFSEADIFEGSLVEDYDDELSESNDVDDIKF